MSVPTDLMTQMMLAQITDLQRRVTQQDNVIASLKMDVERLLGSGGNHSRSSPPMYTPGSMRGGDTMRGTHQGPGPVYNARASNQRDNRGVHTHGSNHSIPLTHIAPPPPSSTGTTRDGAQGATQSAKPDNKYNDKRKRPQIVKPITVTANADEERAPPIALSALLKDGEKVTLSIGVGKDENGAFTYTTCSATFTGDELCVTECEKVASMIGEKSDKPGALLYKFMTELKNGGHIQRMFKIAPWKLCSVVRDGKTMTLEELKSDA